MLVEMDRVATDIQDDLAENWKPVQGVEFVGCDAFAIDFTEKFDMVISSQTVEHLENPREFVEKLLHLSKGLLLSTTYETPQGLIEGHIQDPISLEKLKSWFPVTLDAWTICYHPLNKKNGHIIGGSVKPSPVRTKPFLACRPLYHTTPMPTYTHPVASKQNVLARLSKFLPISAIVDVGVRECTIELIQAFPNQHHHLFEPMEHFKPVIEKNYASLPHTLITLALSNVDASLYLIQSSLKRDGCITHSQISSTPRDCDGHTIISCDPFVVRRYDSLDLASHIAENYLLKVDVDGKDLEVLQGFGQHLQKASVVIIECTTETLIKRIGYLESQGFRLIDLVDITHYGPALYQLDAVLVRSDLVTIELKPNIGEFQQELWRVANV